MPKFDGAEFERRIHVYLHKLKGQRLQSRFIKAAICVAEHGEVHGLLTLGDHCGIKRDRRFCDKTGRYEDYPTMTHRRMLERLIDADLVEEDYEDVFVRSLDRVLKNHRHVIRLKHDLLKKEESEDTQSA